MRKFILLFLVAVLLSGLVLAGCGNDQSDESGTETAVGGEDITVINDADQNTVANGETEDDSVSLIELTAGEEEPFNPPDTLAENWINFRAFVKLVQSAQWGLDDMVFSYNFEKTEQVNGIVTDKVSIRFEGQDGETDEMTMWVDDNGSVVQALSGGEELESDQYETVKALAVPPLLPFALEEYNPGFNEQFRQSLAGNSSPDWELLNFSREKDWLGGKPVDIYTVELQHDSFGTDVASFSFGDFGPFRIILASEYSGTALETRSIVFR